MISAKGLKTGAIGLGVALAFAAPGPAQAPGGALAALQPGMWQLRSVGGSSAGGMRSICVRDPAQLLQVRHGSRGCPQRILQQDARTISVRYECSGAGWGQTTISVETPRLAQIDTQGIEGGAPFHNVLEARRTGDCS